MSAISGESNRDFIIARRELHEDNDAVTLMPEFLVIGAPEDTDVSEIKSILEKSGRYDCVQWREYRVLPDTEWSTQENWDDSIEYIRAWASDIYYEEELAQCLKEPAQHGTTYEELVGKLQDEKRITLRLPTALHVALKRAAGGEVLNSFCIEKLAQAVGYGELNQFEAQRRKPGRPKKVQESE